MRQSTPQLKAAFVCNEAGEPRGRKSGNYHIKLFVIDAPPDAYAVTYTLHSSYYDPIREALDKEENFAHEITSYGNFDVVVNIHARRFLPEIRRSLYDALKETHVNSSQASIREALKDIRDN